MKLRLGWVVVACFCMILSGMAQNAAISSASVSVPPVIQFSNVATDEGGTPLTGTVSITFSLYNSSQGGQPLWTETQNVQVGNEGQYFVYLGLTQANGLPANLFTSSQAQWLGVKIESQPEQPRLFLVSVPYAMKAGDAATIGGLPPSAFAMAATPSSPTTAAGSTEGSAASRPTPATNGDVTGLGTVDYIPIWDSASDIISSVIVQSGAGSTAKIGINTTTPTTTLDVKGTATLGGATAVMGALSLPATGTATASAGKDSEPIKQAASAYNSSTSTAVNQTFEWQAEPLDNDTSTASGSLNLLFGQGTAAPGQTGLSIASNGQITFAEGQTFPGTGTGDGTITGVTAGTGLNGGGASGSVTLANTGILALTAGTGVSLTSGQSPTVSVNTSQVPLLSSANTFTNSQTVSGNLTATGVVSGSSFQIGSALFAYGSSSLANAFLGFAGNTIVTGIDNTATGYDSLITDTTGLSNTAAGAYSLYGNTTGSENTASGMDALVANTTGNSNTAAGYLALYLNVAGNNNAAFGTFAGAPTNGEPGTGSNDTFIGYGANPGTQLALNNASAIGANAQVAESNALVLGSINGVNGAIASTNVGIGTTAPASTLDVEGNLAAGSAPILWLKNDATLQSGTTGNSVDIRFTPDNGGAVGTPNAYIRAQENGSGNYGTFLSFGTVANGGSGASENMRIASTGNVGIGTTAPDDLLSVNGSADKPGGGSWATFSDRRLKNLDGGFRSGLAQIMQINPVLYRYKQENALGIRDRDEHVGLVAQEVQKVIPAAVSENAKGYLLVNNDPIIWAMLNAIKEQQKQIVAQENQIKKQQRVVSAQSVAITRQQHQLRAQRSELLRMRQKVGRLETNLQTAGKKETSSASSSRLKTETTASLQPSER